MPGGQGEGGEPGPVGGDGGEAVGVNTIEPPSGSVGPSLSRPCPSVFDGCEELPSAASDVCSSAASRPSTVREGFRRAAQRRRPRPAGLPRRFRGWRRPRSPGDEPASAVGHGRDAVRRARSGFVEPGDRRPLRAVRLERAARPAEGADGERGRRRRRLGEAARRGPELERRGALVEEVEPRRARTRCTGRFDPEAPWPGAVAASSAVRLRSAPTTGRWSTPRRRSRRSSE